MSNTGGAMTEAEKINLAEIMIRTINIDVSEIQLKIDTAQARVVSQSERIAELEDREETRKQLDKSKLPCGHLSRYGVTDDGGKHCSCVLCRAEAAEAQLAALRETTLVEAVNEIRSAAAACDSDLLHGMCHASNVVNRMTARYQTPLLKEEK